jgi:hypothetical protein
LKWGKFETWEGHDFNRAVMSCSKERL